MEKIKEGNLDEMPNNRGWCIGGKFFDPPALFETNNFEVKWSKHPEPHGDKKLKPDGGPVKTITVLIKGKFKISFPHAKKEVILSKVGDYVYFGENVVHDWKCLEKNTRMLTIRWPSKRPKGSRL